MGIPVKYRVNGGEAIASYNFFDIATGAGYKTFYLADLYNVATKEYRLIGDIIYSSTGYTQSASNGTLDLDFDLSLALPMQLKGDATISIPINMQRVTSTGGGSTVFSGSMLLVRNGVETQIGSTSQQTITYADLGASNSTHWNIVAFAIRMPTTKLKGGDTLRFNLQSSAGGANVVNTIFHDPEDRTFTDLGTGIISSKSTINLPFKIDL